ncbi:uncharacterized protein [Drosophila pseudoobscura]|uniref:Transmembrane protein n=1 Tax=Drosophila pseudoobscura pseudoobscura TaxID=46245 RepID=A0A6I8VRG5_DROPS|nr:uncharacterized protein LOC117183530 [Drosophila pseudoobscura]
MYILVFQPTVVKSSFDKNKQSATSTLHSAVTQQCPIVSICIVVLVLLQTVHLEVIGFGWMGVDGAEHIGFDTAPQQCIRQRRVNNRKAHKYEPTTALPASRRELPAEALHPDNIADASLRQSLLLCARCACALFSVFFGLAFAIAIASHCHRLRAKRHVNCA